MDIYMIWVLVSGKPTLHSAYMEDAIGGGDFDAALSGLYQRLPVDEVRVFKTRIDGDAVTQAFVSWPVVDV